MEKKMSKVGLVLIFVIVVVVFGPLLTIWSLNTLFPVLAIPYSIETWLATAVIAGIFRGDGISFKGK
jgi:hypothetical protein